MVGWSWIFIIRLRSKRSNRLDPSQPLFYCRYWFQIFLKWTLLDLEGSPIRAHLYWAFVSGSYELFFFFFFSNFLCLWKWEMSNHDESVTREGKKIQSVLGKTWGEKNSNLFCQLFWDRENLQSAKHYMTCQVRWEIFAIPSDNLHRKREN